MSRFVAVIAALVMSLVVVTALAGFSLVRADRLVDRLVLDHSRNLFLAQHYVSESNQASRKARAYLLTGDGALLSELKAHRRQAQAHAGELRSAVRQEPARGHLVEMLRREDETASAVDRALAAQRAGDVAEARRMFEEEVQPSREKLDEVQVALVDALAAQLNQEYAESERSVARTSGLLLAVLGAGLVIGVMGTAVSIVSARRERRARAALEDAELRYRTFIRQTTEGIWRIAVDEPIPVTLPAKEQVRLILERAYVAEGNQATATTLGYPSPEAMVGARLPQVMLTPHQVNEQLLLEFVRRGYRLEDREALERDLSGEVRVTLNSVLGTVVNGELVGAWGTQRDVTELKSIERELRVALDRAEVAVRARDDFLSIASHELKTPLTPLSLRLDLLDAAVANEQGTLRAARFKSDIQAMRRQVRRLSNLINDLLDISRLAAGRFRLELRQLNLAQLVEEVAQRFELEARRAGSTLRVDVGGSAWAYWDELRVEQVLSNLVSNAIKYGAGRPIEVRLRPGPQEVTLEVRDQGIGISAEQLPHVFDKFSRMVSDEEGYTAGLGLGLFITRQLVEAMGGVVEAQSVLGRGSTFRVRLPYRWSSDSRFTHPPPVVAENHREGGWEPPAGRP